MSIGMRIKLARKHAGLTQAQLAERCGWEHQSRVANYESPKLAREPSQEDVRAMAEACGVSFVWLLTGEGEMLAGELQSNAREGRPITTWSTREELGDAQVLIPRYEVFASLGKGNEVHEEPEERTGDAYRAAFAKAQGWSPATHFSMRVEGDSMVEAGLLSGWSIVVDSKDKRVDPGEIYAICYNDKLLAKFLEVLPGGGLKIISANRSHPVYRDPVELSATQAEHVRILGRVVHAQGLIGKRRGR